MPKKDSRFSKKLISWYLQNMRDLPWRNTSDPYPIWLSEILLQQTRVAQGLPYYLKFIEKYPSVQELASATEDDVLKLWQGLGYYSRARNLHFIARYIVEQLDGKFPDSYEALLKLKGVGDYTASAIASICFQEPTAVVDGNVYRFLSRVFGIHTPINETEGIKEFKTLAQILVDADQPGIHNQAMMEFGARYCVPQNPACNTCIFSIECLAFKRKLVSQLPVKKNKQKIRNRYFNYLVAISEDNKTILEQRLSKGIWHKLYEYPLIESENELDLFQLKRHPEYLKFEAEFPVKSLDIYNENPIIHKLSHQNLFATFWIVYVGELEDRGIAVPDISKFAVPVLIENFMTDFSLMKN